MGCRASAARNRESSHGGRGASLGVSASSNINADMPHFSKNSLSASPCSCSRKEVDAGKVDSSYTRNGELCLRQRVHTHDDNPLEPPPSLPPEVAHRSSSLLVRRSSSISRRTDRIPSPRCHASGSASPRVKDAATNGDGARREQVPNERPENHFDPLLIPTALHLQEPMGSRVASSSLPSRPSSCIATLDSEDRNATFRTEIESHDKTDSVQAAKEYQQHVQARRSAEAAHTKWRQLEDFDPVRPVDSFNVTHRGLLGRCWDRRAPELIPVSFVHTMDAALRATEETHPACATTSHLHEAETGREELAPASSSISMSPLSHTSLHLSGVAGGSAPSQPMSSSPRGAGFSERRVPRRSHWFSVGGISCDTVCPPLKSNGVGSQAGLSVVSSYCMSSGVSSPITSWAGASGPGFPLSTPSPARNRAGTAMLKGKAKPFIDIAASSQAIGGGAINSLSSDGVSDAAKPHLLLTAEQISALPMAKREQYYNDFLTRNPLFMGIKRCFAFRLADGVSEDPSIKFLRKRNLEPAPGVVAKRWNRVEFFHPTLDTLIRAVAMTEGMTLHPRPPSTQHSCLSFAASGNHMLHVTGEESSTIAETLSRSSLSQYVLSYLENCSFSRGSGSPNNSFLHQSDKQRGTADSSGTNINHTFLGPSRNHSPLPDKDGSVEAGAFSVAKFPEDSVLALALCIPSARLPSLMGVLPTPHQSGIGRSSSCLASAADPKTSRDSSNNPAVSAGASSAAHGAFTCAGSDGSVLVAISVSSFSVSMDPFRWQEHRYIRYPIDMDDSKRSSRHTYGEGVVTDVMYGGIMFVEASSVTAVKALQTLLSSMTWTEGRTLSDVVGDVRKHLKVFEGSGSKVRPAAALHPAVEQKKDRYRICSRVGGRPMRDAVELQEISYYLDDVEVREEIVTLNRPIKSDNTTAARGDAAGPGRAADSSVVSESKHICHSSSLSADPDVSPSFSRVASVWVTLPVIAAVLRTWALHLLSNPESAQPTALFLQKYAGIAPVLQTSALGALYDDDDSHSEDVSDDVDYLFFEGNGLSVTVPTATGIDANHPQPAPRIPQFNRFYASKPSTPLFTVDEQHPSHPAGALHLPAEVQKRDTALDEQAASGTGRSQSPLKKPTEDTSGKPSSTNQNPEVVESEALVLAGSVNSCGTAPEVKSGRGRQSSCASSFATKSMRVVGKRCSAATTSTEGAHRKQKCGWGVEKANPHRAAKRSLVRRHPATQCDSPLTPRSTRPQSRRNDVGCEQGSLSSSSSSSTFPSSPALTKAGTNDFQGNLSSVRTSSSSTRCLPGNKLHQPALQNLSRRRLSGSTCAPSPLTPAERGKEALGISVPAAPLLTPSTMADTVGPDSLAAAVASGKKIGPDAVQAPCQVAFRSPLIHKGKVAATPSTVLAAAEPATATAAPSLPLPPKATRAKAAATPMTTTASKDTSAAAIVVVPTKLRGATATSTCRRQGKIAKRRRGLVKQTRTPVMHFVKGVERACSSPSSLGESVRSAGITVNSTETLTACRATEDEEEEMWHMAMLEVKAQQQELEELRQACRDAEDTWRQREDLLRSLNRILLPHTAPQELDSVLLYLKTAICEPEDMPHGRLFLQQPSWLPMLVAVWTAPANRIRAVEIAAELTWVDIPRLGFVAGLLHHQYASETLEELIIRTDKLLGSPHAAATLPRNYSHDRGLVDETTAAPSKLRLLAGRSCQSKRGKSSGRGAAASRGNNLNFPTELDQMASGFGLGCPPFVITPEEARDTLWLLLCSVAANMRVPTFRVVLRGLPKGEISTAPGGSDAGRARNHSRDRTPFTYLASSLAEAVSRFRDKHDHARPLLKPHFMTLDNVVVCSGPRLGSSRDVQRTDNRGLGTSTTRSNTTYDDSQLICTSASMQLEEDGATWSSSFMSERRAGSTFRQTSSFVVMSLPAEMSASIGGAVCSPDRHRCSPNTTLASGHPVTALTSSRGEASAGVLVSEGSGGKARAIGNVYTSQHRAQRHRGWMRNGNSVEEWPFYELLVHRCEEEKEATPAAKNDAGHARFDAEPDSQQRQQEAVSHSEAPSQLLHSRPPSPSPRDLPRSGFVRGLRTAEDEQVALRSEVTALRERAGDIWEALRKSVKHYNQRQMEAHQKAMKRIDSSQSPSSPPPQPPRQIVLEY
ncbi:hypothetical protein, conserved [Leishmania tarentolae]|uniref:Uncharacterized protein n=1 Tax=Leishmania tarentolae TaxID=5689 RepID=A0A640KCR6_LEITA|nr:hypothetical protein, conserved [Leishmania tarentolae]